MDVKPNVIILAEPIYLSTLTQGLQMQGLAIACASSRLSDIKTLVERIEPNTGNYMLLAECGLFTDKLFAVTLKAKHIPMIAIASSVKDGFAMMELGAVDMVVRQAYDADISNYVIKTLAIRIREALSKAQKEHNRPAVKPAEQNFKKIIAIGSSTGGTETILKILQKMPADIPPVLVVQHMPPVFTKLYADRLNNVCAINVWEARDGDALANGTALIAPGDYHMTLAKKGGVYYVECKKGERVFGQCPSVDVLFNSVACIAGNNAIGVILTGMGADGAEGLLRMRMRGAYTIGQDEATCVVYGMPRAAFEMGAVSKQLPMEQIANGILEYLNKN